MNNLLTLEIDNDTFHIKKGERLVDISSDITSVNFSCLEGRCGRCVVKIIDGHIGELTDEESLFFELMGLDPNNHKLICQSTMLQSTIVETV